MSHWLRSHLEVLLAATLALGIAAFIVLDRGDTSPSSRTSGRTPAAKRPYRPPVVVRPDDRYSPQYTVRREPGWIEQPGELVADQIELYFVKELAGGRQARFTINRVGQVASVARSRHPGRGRKPAHAGV